ncbi:MAG: hypothetical protein JNL28_09445 [Planctomycetes bacterium]|nr:hypothetical protein [Planctomycetota bacterium]
MIYIRAQALSYCALVALSAALPAQVITVLVKDGDSAGAAGIVTAIDNLAVNSSGTWLVETSTNSGLSTMFKNGPVFLQEGDALPLPLGSSISSFDDITINEAGTSGWNFFLSGLTTDTDSGIFVNSTLLLQESDVSIAPQFSAGTVYRGFFGTKWNDSGQLLVMATVDDPAIAGTTDRALVRLQLDPAFALVSETVLVKKGDNLPGFGMETLAELETAPYGYAMNSSGAVLYLADMTGAATSDVALVHDDGTGPVIIAREGSASPVAGRNYEIVDSRPVDISNGGHIVYRANLDGATTDDEVIIVDGAVLVQEGSGLPAIGGFTFTAFGTVVRADASGNVFWWGDWNDPDTTRDTGLFVNHELLVQEGVTTAGGIVIEFVASVQDSFWISADGRYVIFEGRLTGGIDAAFLLDRGPITTPSTPFCLGDGTGAPCPCANTGAAGHGCGSSAFAGGAILSATGIAGASLGTDTLVLTATDIPGPGLFFQSNTLAASPINFGDGHLCATGGIIRLGVVFPSSGVASYPGGLTPNPIHVQGGATNGQTKHYQCWYRSVPGLCTANNYDLTQGLTLVWGP